MVRALYTATSGMMVESRGMELLAHNLGNVHTPGFRSSGLLRQGSPTGGSAAGVQSSEAGRFLDRSAGTLRATGRFLDLALEGVCRAAEKEFASLLFQKMRQAAVPRPAFGAGAFARETAETLLDTHWAELVSQGEGLGLWRTLLRQLGSDAVKSPLPEADQGTGAGMDRGGPPGSSEVAARDLGLRGAAARSLRSPNGTGQGGAAGAETATPLLRGAPLRGRTVR